MLEMWKILFIYLFIMNHFNNRLPPFSGIARVTNSGCVEAASSVQATLCYVLLLAIVACCFLFPPEGSLSAAACWCCSPGSVISGCGCEADSDSGHAWLSEGSGVLAG